MIDLEKPRFVGREALIDERARGGPSRRLVGLELDWEGIEAAYERHGIPPVLLPGTFGAPVPAYRDGRQVGKATSMTWSPILKKYIALAHLQGNPGALEIEFTIEHKRRRAQASVAKKPFFDPERKRK